uniref:Uncharacterized protein ORF9 n=1 Tax=Alternaria alternata TaxID=5599 RepID=C9K7D4_ALTAL|nr:hypothetical protein [Alternaria alternata]
MATWLQYRTIGLSVEQQLGEQRTTHAIYPLHSEEKIHRGRSLLVVGWNGQEDPMNPRNWSISKKWTATFMVSMSALLVGVCASIESPVRTLAAEDLRVSEIVESLSVALFLVGFGFGAMVSGPASEVLGRSGTYSVSNNQVSYLVDTRAPRKCGPSGPAGSTGCFNVSRSS